LRSELPASGAENFGTGGLERSDMKIDFDKMNGLAPAIVQEDSTGEVLMVGFMNAEAYLRTVETGYVTFYSRTRQRLWMKGE
jgi:phosphoribosyl-AMP cyclohydrolase